MKKRKTKVVKAWAGFHIWDGRELSLARDGLVPKSYLPIYFTRAHARKNYSIVRRVTITWVTP